MSGLVLDAGAFIALENRDAFMTARVQELARKKTPLVTSAGVVARVWRGGSDAQVPFVFLLRRAEVVDLTYAVAKLLGRMMGERGTRDPVDAHVAYLARDRGWPVLTSDPDDLRALDSTLDLRGV